MSSKAFIFLGLLFAIVLLLSSEEVTARDVKSVEEAVMGTDGVEDDKRGIFGGRRFHRRGHHGHGHLHCHHGCCSHYPFTNICRKCCSFAGEAVDAEPQAKPHN